MMILRLPLLENYIYVNADKILFFEPTKTNCTELHLDSGEALILPMTPEELCAFISQPDGEPDTMLLKPSDIEALFYE
jgi:hypothetical protein